MVSVILIAGRKWSLSCQTQRILAAQTTVVQTDVAKMIVSTTAKLHVAVMFVVAKIITIAVAKWK